MPLTREFKETVQARLQSDRKYRKELLREGVEWLLAGDLDTGKAILRNYINATIGFDELSRRTKRPAKSLMRMLGPRGNPQARNLLEVIQHLQRAEGLHFESRDLGAGAPLEPDQVVWPILSRTPGISRSPPELPHENPRIQTPALGW
jgi:DNA-binding phage protein